MTIRKNHFPETIYVTINADDDEFVHLMADDDMSEIVCKTTKKVATYKLERVEEYNWESEHVLVSATSILEAMSVVPIAWLSAADIAGEMQLEQGRETSRYLLPYLRGLMRRGQIIRDTTAKPTLYRLSDDEAKKAIEAYEAFRPQQC